MPYLYIVRLIDKASGEVVQTMEFTGKLALCAFFEGCLFFPDVKYEVTRAS